MKYNVGEQLFLDDNILYTVQDSLSYEGKNYYFLTYEEDDREKFLILKEGTDDTLVNLDSDDEFDNLFFLFGKKNSNN